MSLSSIGYNYESTLSSLPEIKVTGTPSICSSLKRLEPYSADNFQNFLISSPYLSPLRSPVTPKDALNSYKDEILVKNEEAAEIIEPRKRSFFFFGSNATPIEESFEPTDRSMVSPLEYFNDHNPPKTNQSSISQNKHRSLRIPEVHNLGFDIPEGLNLSKEALEFVEGLQTRITKLEKQVLGLKTDNYKLKEDNKKMSEKMIIVIQEQEKAGKVKDMYERRISQLSENFQTNNEIEKSLKEILVMQEDEYYNRVVKKDKSIAYYSRTDLKKPSIKLSARSNARSSTSIEINSSSSKELLRTNQKPKSILKTEAKRSSFSIPTFSSMKARNPAMSSTKVTIRD